MDPTIERSSNAHRGFRVQAPLVDSVSCYCNVDSGLKTVAGARKFVPGSKLCIQSDISSHAHKTKNSRRERSRVQPPHTSGLPDLAIACLVRVPRVEHSKLRLVCKRWYRLLAGNFFYSLRKSLGMAEEWVYVVKRDRDGRISWHAFDPSYQLWQPLPPVPGEYSEALGFGCAVLSGCHLYLFGGKDPIKGSIRGGHRGLFVQLKFMTKSEALGFIADMSTAMVPFIGVVYDGKCSRALEAAALVPLKGKLCIIRNNMSISIIDVSNPDKRVKPTHIFGRTLLVRSLQNYVLKFMNQVSQDE
ncbi:hypothetical protein HAX54_042988 [Datura stramonium]|uniref:F-box domain-containing protein n=1 Tax=Datura stramonium TaxID=4076 RepID=A0ABS8W4S5_DATST|nr:hypothetical protein [Datura stramonium]